MKLLRLLKRFFLFIFNGADAWYIEGEALGKMARSLNRKTKTMSKRALFVGRWQPFHKGHEWLIRQKLDKDIPVLIAVRDIEPDDYNPYSTGDTVSMLEAAFDGEDVEVIIISDIESVNYGRGVGYEINEFQPPEDIKRISATQIRDLIKAGDESWREFVNSNVAEWLENYYKD